MARVPAGLGGVRYRGWMVSADQYAALSGALAARGAQLLSTPEQYRTAHELPGWYRHFADLTPASGWCPAVPGQPPTAEQLTALARALPPGPGIVKDYVKSRKHEWHEACFVPDLADPAGPARVVHRFVELQDEFLAGGIVLRAYEEFVRPQDAAAEVRVWWLDGEPRLLTPHPDSPAARLPTPEPELAPVAHAVRALPASFVTTDLALRADGVWRVVEMGDAQVSELHPAADRAEFAALLTEPGEPLR